MRARRQDVYSSALAPDRASAVYLSSTASERVKAGGGFLDPVGEEMGVDVTPDNEEPSPYSMVNYEEPPPMFSKPTRLRLKHRTLAGGCTYEPGTEAEFNPATAEWLVSDGHAEVA